MPFLGIFEMYLCYLPLVRNSVVTKAHKIAVKLGVAFSGESDLPLEGTDRYTIMHSDFSILGICTGRSTVELHLEE